MQITARYKNFIVIHSIDSLKTCACRVAALVAIAFYLVGAASNAALRRGTGADGGCYNLRSGAFTRAAVLTLVAAGLGIVSFILLTRRPHRMASAGNGPKPDGHTPLGVAMQPQYPAA